MFRRICRVEERRARNCTVDWKGYRLENGEELAANRVFSIVSEVPFGEAADGSVSSIEEPFVDRDIVDSVAIQAVNDAASGAEGQQRAAVWLPRLGRAAQRLEIGESGGAPDEIDLAPDRARGKIESVIENQPPARVHLAVAEIERLGQADRADEIRGAAEKLRKDVGARDSTCRSVRPSTSYFFESFG